MTDKKLRTKLIEQIDNLSRGKGDWVGQIRGVVKTCDQATQLARAEERERIADEFGDFRLMAKGWLGIIKYGRTLRFFLLPHTKHKKGDDESN